MGGTTERRTEGLTDYLNDGLINRQNNRPTEQRTDVYRQGSLLFKLVKGSLLKGGGVPKHQTEFQEKKRRRRRKKSVDCSLSYTLENRKKWIELKKIQEMEESKSERKKVKNESTKGGRKKDGKKERKEERMNE